MYPTQHLLFVLHLNNFQNPFRIKQVVLKKGIGNVPTLLYVLKLWTGSIVKCRKTNFLSLELI